MEYRNITNPKWVNEEQTLIDCNVKIKINGVWENVPFTANQNDPEKHGRDIYAEAVQMDVSPFTVDPQAITDHIKAYRRAKENGGITVSGVTVQTDVESRASLLGAVQLNTSIDWKTDNGFVTLTAQQISAIATAVGQHVQACFSSEKTVSEAHAITPYTSKAAIEEAFDNAYNS